MSKVWEECGLGFHRDADAVLVPPWHPPPPEVPLTDDTTNVVLLSDPPLRLLARARSMGGPFAVGRAAPWGASATRSLPIPFM
jgi:hypothetical protein